MAWIRRLREAPVTLGLVAVNLVVYAAMVASSHRILSFDQMTLVEAGASVYVPNVDISRWRWLTAAFVHHDMLHIALNLWVLGQIGIISEHALGRGLIAAAYVVTGTLGNALSFALAASRGRDLVSAGASGAIMGLIGMAATFAWLSGQRAAARVLALNVLFVLGVGLSLSASGVSLIDNAAHIGGLVAGVAIGVVRVRVTRPSPRWLDATLIAGSLAVTAVAFVAVRFGDG